MERPLLAAWASTMEADVSSSGASVDVWTSGTASFTQIWQRHGVNNGRERVSGGVSIGLPSVTLDAVHPETTRPRDRQGTSARVSRYPAPKRRRKHASLVLGV